MSDVTFSMRLIVDNVIVLFTRDIVYYYAIVLSLQGLASVILRYYNYSTKFRYFFAIIGKL